MDLEKTLRQALGQMQEEDLAGAELLFLALLNNFPGEPNTCNYLGLLRRKQGRLLEAEILIRQAITAYPGGAAFHNNLANVLAAQGRRNEAMNAYRTTLLHEPRLLEARINLANFQLLAGNRSEALRLVSTGLDQEPGDLELLCLHGALLGIGNLPSTNPSPPMSPWLSSPFAFLAEPDWRSGEWKNLVIDFALSFAAWEPVTLLLFLDPSDPAQPRLAGVEGQIRHLLAGTRLESIPTVAVVLLDSQLPVVLSRFSRLQWLHQDPGVLAGLEGQVCVRLAARRYARSMETRPGLAFAEAISMQVSVPVEDPPWAAAPMGTSFLLNASWPEDHLRGVLEALLSVFNAHDPVACLLLLDQESNTPSAAWLARYLEPGSGPGVHLVKDAEGLNNHLRRFPKLLRLPGPPGNPAGLEGHQGMRLAEALHRQFHGKNPSPRPDPIKAPQPRTRPLKVLCFTSEAARHATFQLRIGGPAWAHRSAVELQRGLSLAESAEGGFDFRKLQEADLIIIQRFFPRNETRVFLDAIFSSGKPVILETDDLVHCIPEFNPSYLLSTLSRDFLLDAMNRATALVVSTPVLGEELAGINPCIEVMPNLLDQRIWGGDHVPLLPVHGPVVIGYCGSPTHFEDLALAEEALVRVAEKHGSRVAFRFFGCVTGRLERLPAATITAFTDDYEAYAGALRTGGIQIAVAPLVDHRFNRCKSHIKWLEYSAVGAAGVFSDLAPYRTAIRNGETGLLASADPQSWFDAVDHLVSDPEARIQMGQRAHRELRDHHMLSPASPWLGILERAMQGGTP